MRKIPQARVDTKSIPFTGGLDVVTTSLFAKKGKVSSSQNFFEDIDGGYVTLEGYEVYSGEPPPSGATFALMIGSGDISVGDVVTDSSQTASGTVVAFSADLIVLVNIQGAFPAFDYLLDEVEMTDDKLMLTIDGAILVDGVQVGVYTGWKSTGTCTNTERALYASLAADNQRSTIDPPVGSGECLGTWHFDGVQYAFRNNAAGTAVVMHKDSSSGWVAVDLGHEINFTTGNLEPIEQQVVVGATSLATATIEKIITNSDLGSWAGGDEEGRLILSNVTDGPFVDGETLTTVTSTMVADGDSFEITFAVPSGKFEFVNANFTGSMDTRKMYGCDGMNRAFEFDGSVFVPISTGMTSDYPEHIWEHKNHLFLSFRGSVQNSAPGLPYQWSVIVGAGENGLGDRITGFAAQPGTGAGATLAMFSSNQTAMLYGSSVDDFVTVPYKNGVGAISNTVQSLGNTFFLSDRGITKLSTTQSYGNFADATVSQNIQPWLRTKKNQVTTSCIVRDKNQYWIFFADKSAICCTVDNGEIVSAMPMLLSHVVSCISSQEDESGNEIVMFGSTDGHVRKLFSGTSFDGEKIEAFLDLHYVNFGAPFTEKLFRLAMLEAHGTGYCECTFSYSLGYGASDIATPATQVSNISLSAESWDKLFTWETSVWDGSSLSPSFFPLDGEATNISLKFKSNSARFSSVKYSGAIIQYTPLGDIR